MWYFTWILGVGVALSFGIVNVMWLESRRFDETGALHRSPAPRQRSEAAPEARSTDSRRF